MFDDIRCEYPLPLPEDQGELVGKDWTKHGFQTKDLGEGMGEYCIRRDGTLWTVGTPWLGEEIVEPVFSEDFFGAVGFYDTIYGRKNDYWVQWKATFANGKLNEIRLAEWQLRDNTGRLRQEEKRKAERERRERFLKTWLGRYVYPGYASIVGLILGQVFGRGSYELSNALQKVRMFALKLERRLAPHGDPVGTRLCNYRFKRREQRRNAELSKQKPE